MARALVRYAIHDTPCKLGGDLNAGDGIARSALNALVDHGLVHGTSDQVVGYRGMRAFVDATHHGAEEDRLRSLGPEDRYRELREIARARGIDVRDDDRVIQRRLDAMERKVRRVA
jgi:hypothetical protein